MSWLARSIANTLKFDDDDDETDKNEINTYTKPESESDHHPDPDPDPDQQPQQSPTHSTSSSSNTPRGVKEDLTDFTKTLTRQIWGVASFLAPPPPSSSPPQSSSAAAGDVDEEEEIIAGIKNDFAEIGGKFKSGISKLSNNINVSEITKMASNFLQFESNDVDLVNACGVTEDVLAFARNVALHPETWLDFPVPDEDDFDDFDMSDAQQEHALAVERLVPQLGALRFELCPGHMSDGCFWKIYFVLLHPRLSKEDADLLSTPQIVEARALLMPKLRNQVQSGEGSALKESSGLSNEENLSVPIQVHSDTVPVKTSDIEASKSNVAVEIEIEKHPVHSSEVEVIDKSVVKEEMVSQTKHQPSSAASTSKVLDEQSEDDVDDWLKEDESSDVVGVSGTSMVGGNDEDVSFSDLEEDDRDVPVTHKKTYSGSDSSTKDSRDWVQL